MLIVEGTRIARPYATGRCSHRVETAAVTILARGFFETVIDVLVGQTRHSSFGLDPRTSFGLNFRSTRIELQQAECLRVKLHHFGEVR